MRAFFVTLIVWFVFPIVSADKTDSNGGDASLWPSLKKAYSGHTAHWRYWDLDEAHCDMARCRSPAVGGGFDCLAGTRHEACSCNVGRAVQLEDSSWYEGELYYHYTCCTNIAYLDAHQIDSGEEHCGEYEGDVVAAAIVGIIFAIVSVICCCGCGCAGVVVFIMIMNNRRRRIIVSSNSHSGVQVQQAPVAIGVSQAAPVMVVQAVPVSASIPVAQAQPAAPVLPVAQATAVPIPCSA
mmetsp:Transcript_7203/g.12142  ORF Transcript_7203/g.12142 Transcript_7203/m.12142 type:complete len:239 (-) Transcript_7203:265-981(-)|eukprot:CAMPEP_0119324208 /NCGR_PEP_ID=MMETSP1333-20130426/62590_1 /TAXON_ID=418940 /ORGANISM="Scyphosphaera apsteinii, Strain RCC1455" /LENGTH=238 /DNA_ID=CAMNT_0007331853 /DNA_START=68 /DNA_END=784 /DNA_ORIENTATION=-